MVVKSIATAFFHRVLMCAALGAHTLALAQAPDARSCNCPPDHLFTRYSAAEQVFYGEVDSGWLDEESQHVHFEVVVIDAILGNPPERVTLSTPLSADCGLEIRAGMENVFVLRSDSKQVSYCDVQFGNTPVNSALLKLAVALVESDRLHRQTGVDVISDYVKTGMHRRSIEIIFKLAHQIDPSARFSVTEEHAQFRDITVFFKDNLVLTYECR